VKNQAQKKSALGESETHAEAEIAGLDRAVAAKRAAPAAAKPAPKRTVDGKVGQGRRGQSGRETRRRGLPRQGHREAAPDTPTINLKVDKNPRREGAGRHAPFAIIMACD
jgi:hypothetical protein